MTWPRTATKQRSGLIAADEALTRRVRALTGLAFAFVLLLGSLALMGRFGSFSGGGLVVLLLIDLVLIGQAAQRRRAIRRQIH